MKEIPITGYHLPALVDDEDFERLSQFKWRLSDQSINRVENIRRPPGERRLYKSRYEAVYISLAVEVMNRHGVLFDHIDRDPLNNQKHNLRECTVSQNNANRRKMKNSTSNYKGVSWSSAMKKWKVGTTANGVKVHIGYFDDEIEAARAYDTFAITAFKEFACLNFKDIV